METVVAVAAERQATGEAISKQEKEAVERWGRTETKQKEVEMAKLIRASKTRELRKLRQEARKLRLEVWQAKAQAGEKEARYSTFTHKQGKKVRRPELGIRMLRDKKGEWKVGAQVEEVIGEYTKEMWGKREQLEGEILTQEEWTKLKPESDKIEKILDKELQIEELHRAIRKLKKGKTLHRRGPDSK